jgi:hypothetical protein
VCQMVASIEMEYIKELDNKYTGYNSKTLSPSWPTSPPSTAKPLSPTN